MTTLTLKKSLVKCCTHTPVSSESTFPVLIPGRTAAQGNVDDNEEDGDGRADPDAGVEGGVVGVKASLWSDWCVLEFRERTYNYHFCMHFQYTVLEVY